jgi:hypothetical protein
VVQADLSCLPLRACCSCLSLRALRALLSLDSLFSLWPLLALLSLLSLFAIRSGWPLRAGRGDLDALPLGRFNLQRRFLRDDFEGVHGSACDVSDDGDRAARNVRDHASRGDKLEVINEGPGREGCRLRGGQCD